MNIGATNTMATTVNVKGQCKYCLWRDRDRDPSLPAEGVPALPSLSNPCKPTNLPSCTPTCISPRTPTPSQLTNDVREMWREVITPKRLINHSNSSCSSNHNTSDILSPAKDGVPNPSSVDTSISSSSDTSAELNITLSDETLLALVDLDDPEIPHTLSETMTQSTLPTSTVIPTTALQPPPTTTNEPSPEQDHAGVDVEVEDEDNHDKEDGDESSSESPEQPTNSKKRKCKNRTEDKPTKKKSHRKRSMKKISRDQATICCQLQDMDLKVEQLVSSLTKININDTLEQILLTQQQHQQSINILNKRDTSLCSCGEVKTKVSKYSQTLPSNFAPVTTDTNHEQSLEDCQKTITSLGTQISLLEQEYDAKNAELSKLRKSYADLEAQRNTEWRNMNQTLERTNKTLQDTRDNLATSMSNLQESEEQLRLTQIRVDEFVSKEAEWDILMSKRANEIQHLKIENFKLKKDLHESLPPIESELPLHQDGEKRHGNHSIHPRHVKPQKPPKQDADVIILHDSLGFGISPGIMAKQKLTTNKSTCYTLDDVANEVTRLKTVPTKPKVIVVHSGTNDLKNGSPAEDIISKYEDIIEDIKVNFTDTKLVVSTIVPREDNHKLQRNVEYINACLNRSYGDSGDATIVLNNDIRGHRFKQRDGVHLRYEGKNRLGSHIHRGIKRALNIK